MSTSPKLSLLKELRRTTLDQMDKLDIKLVNSVNLSKKELAYIKTEMSELRNKLQDIYKKQREVVRDVN